jgi:hypothetical protein
LGFQTLKTRHIDRVFAPFFYESENTQIEPKSVRLIGPSLLYTDQPAHILVDNTGHGRHSVAGPGGAGQRGRELLSKRNSR